ncbi:integrase/recombinase xerD homolog [Lithobates pipiens]
MECRLPVDKLEALKGEIRRLVGVRKVQLRTLQSVLGKLNFACRIIPMGRVFSRRLAASTGGVVSPKHFVSLSKAHREDLSDLAHVFGAIQWKGVVDVGAVGQIPGIGSCSGGTRDPLPRGTVEACVGRVSGWIRRSVSGGTWSAYERTWNEWEALCEQVQADVRDHRLLVLYFVARNLEDGISVASLGRKLAGLAFWFKLRSVPDLTKDFWVRQAVKGYRKGRQIKDDRRPVSFELLVKICEKLRVVCSSGYEVVLFRAAFVLAFFGVFRIGELVSPSKRGRGGLFVEEVACLTDRVTMKVRRSKTDQDGKGKEVVVFAIPGCHLCPVRVLWEFLGCLPALLGSLLLHERGEFLSRFQFITVFRKCLLALGLGGEKFSSHSFRIGAATEAVRWGLDEESVKRISRWESRRFRSYVRPELVCV